MRALLLCLLVFACRSTQKTRVEEVLPDVIIGEVMSFTGHEAAFGYAARDGIELALRQFNDEGGVHGRRLVARIQDDRDDAAHAPKAFERVLGAQPVAVIGATSSGMTLALAPLAQQAKIPLITPSSTVPAVTQAGNFVFRSCFNDDFQGYAMASFAVKTLGKKSFAVVHVDTQYSRGLAQAFSKEVKALGAEVIADEELKSNTKDLRALLKTLLAKKPEALFVPMSYADAATVLVQARELGFLGTLLGGDGWDSPRMVDLVDGAAEGAYFTTHFAADGDTPEVKKFTKDFSDAFGYEPNGPAAMGYEVGRLVVTAARQVQQLDGPSMRDALATAKVQGLSGDSSMTPSRDPSKPAFVMQIKGGEAKFVTRVQPK